MPFDLQPIPSIPQRASNQRARAAEIADGRYRYGWDYSWPPGVATPDELKRADSFGVRYIARVAALNLEIIDNHERMDLAVVQELCDHDRLRDDLTREFRNLDASRLFEAFFSAGETYARYSSKERPTHPSDYIEYYQTVERPPVVRQLVARPDDDDLLFAWQRIAGANPMVVRCVTKLPAKFPLTQALFARALPGDRLEAALAEGRALLADYALLDGAEQGVNQGRQKYITAPIALFVMDPPGGPGVRRLRPVAIQVTQRPGPESPIFTPVDRWRWQMAKTMVQIADGNLHEAVFHLAQTHLAVGIALVASFNNLSRHHPLAVLLAPHSEYTLAINDSAKKSLIARGGIVDQVLGCSIDATVAAVKAGVDMFVLPEASPRRQLEARGLTDRRALPEIPYRDDALPIWDAIHDFVASYLSLYYHDDAEVEGDWEVKAWFAEMASQDGGRLNGLRQPTTMDELAEWVAAIIFTATAQHSVVNFGQCPFMSYPNNMPGAAWAHPPGPETPDTMESWARLLPPWDAALLTADTVFQLSSVRENILGQYPITHFWHLEARDLVSELKRQLAEIEEDTLERDAERLLTFPFLLPSLIPNSIHI